MSYTTSDLLSIIRTKAFIPSTQSTFSDDDLLALATDEMRDNIVPQIKECREEYYLVSEDFTVTSDKPYVRIPSRAIGGALREVSRIQGNQEYNLSRKSVEDRPYENTSGVTDSFYIKGNRLYPLRISGDTIRLYYYVRPSKLVATTSAVQITGIDTATGIITTGALPSSWGSTGIIDMIEKEAGFDTLGRSISATFGTGQITVAPADIPVELELGDWISLEDTSPVPQIPVEFFPYLAQAVVVQVFDSVGDFDAKASAEQKLEKIEKHAVAMISPRVEGEGKQFVRRKNRGYVFDRWR